MTEDTAQSIAPGPRDLLELRRASSDRPGWFVDLVEPEIGGGRLEQARLTELERRPDATALRISGLDQATFEHLVAVHGSRLRAIEFWKCPRLTDLSPIEDLPDLEIVSFFWNQRATRLWDLSKTPRLTGLRFDDFTRLHDLADLAGGRSLTELEFGDAVWRTSTFTSLEPLSALTGLVRLSIHPRRIDDARVHPLGALVGLESLSLPTNLFSTEQLAWLRARLPHTESRALTAVVRLERPLQINGKSRDTLLVGRRKPLLSSELDAKRIAQHIRDFDASVERFRQNPDLVPS